jgi:hypothetical protein
MSEVKTSQLCYKGRLTLPNSPEKFEPQTQVATKRSAPGGEVEKESGPPEKTEIDIKTDSPILEPPTQVATNRSAPGGEVEEKSGSDPSLFHWEAGSPGDSVPIHVRENPQTRANTGNQGDLGSRPSYKQKGSTAKSQPVTPSRQVEVKNTAETTVPQTRDCSQPVGGKNVQDEIEDFIETLNKTTIEDNKKPTTTPIPSLGHLNVDLMNPNKPKKPVQTKTSGIKEARKAGVESVNKIDEKTEGLDTKVPRKTKTKFFFPKIEKEESPIKDKRLTRKQKADSKKLENKNVPKKNTIE